MRSDTTPTIQCNHLNRRSFLRVAGIATAVGLLSASPAGRLGFAAALSEAQRAKLTPDDIIEMMKRGNERFRRGEETPHDYLAQQVASAKGQYPAAVILSCIDSRAPGEVIMDLGIGDIFNARVAGNIVNDDIAGSIEFPCKLARAKVMCGSAALGLAPGATWGLAARTARSRRKIEHSRPGRSVATKFVISARRPSDKLKPSSGSVGAPIGCGPMAL